MGVGATRLIGSFQSLVQRGPGSLVFLLGNAALLMLHFQFKHLFFQRFEKQTGATRSRPPGRRTVSYLYI